MQFLYTDLGRLERGATVVVTLDKAANVRLMTRSEYGSFKSGRAHRYHGGEARESPVRLAVPTADQYFLTLDLGGNAGTIRHSVRVVGPPPGPLPTIRATGRQDDLRNVRHTLDQSPGAGALVDDRVWDVFISHAGEDKAEVAMPLAVALQSHGVTVWLDALEMRIGDSLRRKIDKGLSSSRFGIVVVSPAFLRKPWPQYELDGLVTMAVSGEQSMLPIWHGVTHDQVRKSSPSLADKLARDTSSASVEDIAAEIAEVVRDPRGDDRTAS